MDISSKLNEVNEKLLSFEDNILSQKDEILKIETFISECLTCLQNQQLALQEFFESKKKLEKEKAECLKLESLDIIDVDVATNNNVKEDNISLLVDEFPHCTGNTNKNGFMTMKWEEDSDDENENINAKPKRIEQVRIPQINNRIVNKIRIDNDDIYIGGSQGMLLRHSSNYTHIYDTSTAADILQIEILKFKNRKSLIAFTKKSVIIFEDITEYVCHEEMFLPEIGTVFNNISALFIPLASCNIKKLHNHDLSMKNFCTHQYGAVRSFVPGDWHNSFALISLSDCRVYKTDKNSLLGLTPIEGIENVIGIRKICRNNFLCYSENVISLLDPLFHITCSFHCHKIRLLDVSENRAGFIDDTNTLYVYSLLKNNGYMKEIAKVPINGHVYALSITDLHTYLSVGEEIQIL